MAWEFGALMTLVVKREENEREHVSEQILWNVFSVCGAWLPSLLIGRSRFPLYFSAEVNSVFFFDLPKDAHQ